MVSELKRVVIYTWAIPQGGLFKVIEKEYEYLSKMIDAPLFVTSEPVPEPYKEEFRKIHGVSLSESIERPNSFEVNLLS